MIGGRCVWMAAGLLIGSAAVAWADTLSDLPAPWRNVLQALEEADLSGAEPLVRQAIEEARQGTAASLADPGVERAQLAHEYGVLGNLYQVHGIPSLAEVSYANARALSPDSFRWIYFAALLALDSGRLEQAADRLSQAARLNPGYRPLQLQVGRAWYEMNNIEQARPALQSAAEYPGLRAAALYYLGQIDLQQRDYRAAIDRFEAVLSLDGQATAVHYPLARAYRATGDIERAQAQLALQGSRLPAMRDPLRQELEALRTGARPLFAAAMQAIEQGDYAAAVTSFQQGLQRDPENSNAMVSLARSQYLAGQVEAARQTLHQVLETDDRQVLGRFLIAVLEDASGNGSVAESRYRALLELEPRHAGAHFFLANRLFRQQQYQTAAMHYRSALDNGRENPFASLYLAVSSHHAGVPEAETISRLERALRRQPEQQLLKYALVRLLAAARDPQQRDPDRALQLAGELNKVLPIPPHLEAAALAQAANGDYEQAVALQAQLLAGAVWMGPGVDLQRLQDTLQAFEDHRLPEQPLSVTDPMLSPMPIDAGAVFREYPSPVPY